MRIYVERCFGVQQVLFGILQTHPGFKAWTSLQTTCSRVVSFIT